MLTLLLACNEPATTDTGADAADTAADSAADTAAADTSGLVPMEVTAMLSEHVSTVVIVRWTTPEATSGYVEFGEDTAYGRVTNVTAEGTTHEVLLLGLHADAAFHFRVVTVGADGAEVPSDDYTITTGSLPAELPTLTVTGDVRSWPGEYMVLPVQGTGFAVAIVDDQGRIVWYDILEGDHNVMKAIVSADRQSLLYCLAGTQTDLSTGRIERVSLDGYQREELPWPNLDHDFTELPDGTFAGIIVTPGENGGQADRIVEMSADGTETREIWSAWNDPGLAAFADADGHNWTHANALDYDPVEDVYYISLKELGTIVKVDRATGASLWYLNGDANGFTFEDPSQIVQMQHQFQVLDDGILIFDNGTNGPGSRVVELALDEQALTAEMVWSYYRDPTVHVYAKGDVERFADGNTQVVWSTAGEIQNVDPDGNVHWQLNTELGYAITFVQRLPSFYE